MESNLIEIGDPKSKKNESRIQIGLIIGGIVLLAVLVAAVIFLLQSEKTPVIRDIFIIFLGFELFMIGVAAILLIFQTTRLINMFQHEIKPVLEAANETLSTVRGTAIFLSETVTRPVIKLNSYFASIKSALQMLKNLIK